MRGGPSLAGRLLLAFGASFLALALLLIAVLIAIYEPRYFGVESAASDVDIHLRRGADGRLRLPSGAGAMLDPQQSPDLWLLVRDAGGGVLSRGAPPDQARRLLSAMPPPQSSGEEALNFTADDGQPATARWSWTEAGPVTMVLGGVSTADMPAADWAIALVAVGLVALAPLLLLFVVLGLIIVPLVLGALRRLGAASAALDGTDLARRLPEAGVVSELRPVVRAFNAALDRVQTASERRDRLIGDIAHELRTPLAVLTLRAEVLDESPAKAELRRGLDRLSQMIGQMLDSERLRAPNRQRDPVDLVALTRGAVAEIAPLAVAEGYGVTFDSEAEAVVVNGDGAAISRAVANLLANAVAHAGGAGEIALRVSARGVVEVEDSGAGLPAGAHERVFEPFHRERWDRDGCGLGLHLVREVMQAHGGRAEAADGAAGALFRLSFPAPAGAV